MDCKLDNASKYRRFQYHGLIDGFELSEYGVKHIACGECILTAYWNYYIIQLMEYDFHFYQPHYIH